MLTYTKEEKEIVLNILSSISLVNNFKIVAESKDSPFVIKQDSGSKLLNIIGAYPIYFYSSNRHVLLNSSEKLKDFISFNHIKIDKIKMLGFYVDFEKSLLTIKTEHFSIDLFCHEFGGWALHFEGESFMLEAIENGGIEVWKETK